MRLRVRPWVIGGTFITFAAVCHAAFRVAPLPDRTEMGRFACLEFLLYAAGLGLLLKSLVTSPMGGARRAVFRFLWIAAALAGLVAVIDSLPS
jgi:hypothetical protein